MKKQCYPLFLFLFALYTPAIAQNLQLQWDTPVPDAYGTVFQAGDRMAMLSYSGLNPNEPEYDIRTISYEGLRLDSFPVPKRITPWQATYSAESQAFYIVGPNTNIDSVMVVKMLADGAIDWIRAVKVGPYHYNWAKTVDVYEDKIMVGFWVANVNNLAVNALAYCLFDAAGNLDYVSELVITPSQYHETVYTAKFDPFGNVLAVRTPLNFGNPMVMIKWDGATGDHLWSTPLPVNMLYSNSSSDFTTDGAGNIYFSCMFNRFIKLSPDGAILVNRPVGFGAYYTTPNVLNRGNGVLLLGVWKTDSLTEDVGAYMAFIDGPTGATQWEIKLPMQDPGVIGKWFGNGIWASDTVLYITHGGANLGKFILSSDVSPVAEPAPGAPPIAVWPNPSPTGAVWFDPKRLYGALRVFNMAGQMTGETTVTGGPVLFHLPAETGTYQVIFQTNEGHTSAVRVVR